MHGNIIHNKGPPFEIIQARKSSGTEKALLFWEGHCLIDDCNSLPYEMVNAPTVTKFKEPI